MMEKPAAAQTDSTRSSSPAAGAPTDREARYWAALKEVLDPEIPISLVDLGLIYALRADGARVEVDVTFTATACPCMDFIREDIETRLLEEPDVSEVGINVVWDPPWTVERVTPEGLEALRRFGVAA